ncbi:hypothetical protein CASFOL_015549 [Castilleja foliolosa]|uniref:Uncharacterized protein n=1 Tax=Castilleja foliolosa TaxID=1961234 RepID=A0ABD3DE21_9LAMI
MVERDAKRCYKKWKSDLHNHFKENGGLADPARVRAKKVCHELLKPCQKIVQEQTGRIPYAGHRDNKTDPETQLPKSVIDNWKEQIPRRRRSRLHDERVAEAAPNGPMDECDILKETLSPGPRRGHMNGVGPRLSHRVRSQQQAINMFQLLLRDMVQRIQQPDAPEAHLCTFIAHVREILGQLAPALQLPDAPPPPPGPSDSSSSSAQPPETEDDDYDDPDFVI